MAMTSPIKTAGTIKKAIKWLSKNQDESYQLAYRLMCNTGLRVTDTTEISWSNVNFDDLTITIEENKGTRGNRARARLKVLEQWHKNLWMLEGDNKELQTALFMRKPKDLLGRKANTKKGITELKNIVPKRYMETIQEQINQAEKGAKAKLRTVDITRDIANSLQQRKHKNAGRDDGFVFSKRVMKSNRARGWHDATDTKLPVITRQSVLAAFKKMQVALAETGIKITSFCHGLRKTYALFLYENNGRDLNIVMQTMGWSDVGMVMRYLGYDEENRKVANSNAQTAIGL